MHRHRRLSGVAALSLATLLACSCTSPDPSPDPSPTDVATESATNTDSAPEAYRGAWEPATIHSPAETRGLPSKPARAWEVEDKALWGPGGLRLLGAQEHFMVLATPGPSITEFAGLATGDGSITWRFTPDAGSTLCAAGLGDKDAVACATSKANPASATLWTLDAYNGLVRQSLPLAGAGTVGGIGFDGDHVYAVVFDPAGKARLVSWTIEQEESELRWQKELPEGTPSRAPTTAPTTPTPNPAPRTATISAAPNILTVTLGRNDISYEVRPETGEIVSEYPGRSATVTQTGDVHIGALGDDPGFIKQAGGPLTIVRLPGAQLGYADRLAVDSKSTDMQVVVVIPSDQTFQTRLYSRSDAKPIWAFERSEKHYPVAVCRQEILLAHPSGLTAIDLRTSAVVWERNDVRPSDDAGFLCESTNFLALTADSITAFAHDDGSTTWHATYEPYDSIRWQTVTGHLISTTDHSVALWR